MPDRCVHAKLTYDNEIFDIVRYNRAGKWWVEGPQSRRPVTIQQAVETACAFRATVYQGLHGGSRFDKLIERSLNANQS